MNALLNVGDLGWLVEWGTDSRSQRQPTRRIGAYIWLSLPVPGKNRGRRRGCLPTGHVKSRSHFFFHFNLCEGRRWEESKPMSHQHAEKGLKAGGEIIGNTRDMPGQSGERISRFIRASVFHGQWLVVNKNRRVNSTSREREHNIHRVWNLRKHF